MTYIRSSAPNSCYMNCPSHTFYFDYICMCICACTQDAINIWYPLLKMIIWVLTGLKQYKLKLNSVVWVRERTIPTERPPLVGEVIANFCGKRVPRGGSIRPYFRFSRQEPLLFYQVAPHLYSRGSVDPVPDPLLRKAGSDENRTRTSGSVARNFTNL
jgi:hypothetical protein